MKNVMNALSMKRRSLTKGNKPASPWLKVNQEENAEAKAGAGGLQGSQKSAPPEKLTLVEAGIDVGFGNTLFIRGQGDGLSWDKGQPLTCIEAARWAWSTTGARDKVVFKLVLNDQTWCQGEDLVVEAGKKIEVKPIF